ncbi:MAG: hypothetical protein P4L51_06075 [Puia sp.]|nr:hypothetical protein [Puia sp.]
MRPFRKFLTFLSIGILLLTTAFLNIALLSCTKDGKPRSGASADQSTVKAIALTRVNLFLKDSLSPGAYDSLAFSQVIVDTATNGNLFLRFPNLGDPVSRRFVLVETTPGGVPLKAACFFIRWDTTAAMAGSSSAASFNGLVTKTWLNGRVAYTSPVANGYILALHPDKSAAAAESNKSIDSDFDGTGETLPDILIEAPLAGDEVIYYMELGEMIDEGGSTGLYEPASGGASIAMLGNPALSARPAINLKGYLGCFGLISNTGATYSLSIYASIPTTNPSVLTGTNGATGESFIGLTKSSGGQTFTQYFGFAPAVAYGAGSPPVPGAILDMGGSAYNASYSVSVTAQQFQFAADDITMYSGIYFNSWNANSSDFAYSAFGSAVSDFFPPELTDPTLGPIETPNGLFLYIQSLQAQKVPGAFANTNSRSSVGASHGNCGGSTGTGAGLSLAP